MNCHACGTPLSQGEAHCSRCGAATQYSYSMTPGAPDDTTLVSTSQNPYEPYQVTQPPPPPPSSQRRGKRTGIIIGAVVLVLLLISAGVFAWREFSTGSPAVVTTTTGTHAASQHFRAFTAKGTSTRLSSTTVTVQQDGNNQVFHLTEQLINYGDITGSFTNDDTVILHPDKTSTFSGKSTCICTVADKSGTLIWSFTGTQTADGSFQGQFFDFHGTGDLAKLHGQGTFQGQGDHNTYSSDLYFDS